MWGVVRGRLHDDTFAPVLAWDEHTEIKVGSALLHLLVLNAKVRLVPSGPDTLYMLVEGTCTMRMALKEGPTLEMQRSAGSNLVWPGISSSSRSTGDLLRAWSLFDQRLRSIGCQSSSTDVLLQLGVAIRGLVPVCVGT